MRVFWNEVVGPINQHGKNIISNLFQMSQLNFKNSSGLGLLWTDDNGRPVRQIYGISTTGWQNSALDRPKFYNIKFPNFVRPQ